MTQALPARQALLVRCIDDHYSGCHIVLLHDALCIVDFLPAHALCVSRMQSSPLSSSFAGLTGAMGLSGLTGSIGLTGAFGMLCRSPM